MVRHIRLLSSFSAACVALCATSLHAADAPAFQGKCPAATIRNAPGFPAACLSAPGDEHQVRVGYDIGEDGAPINVKVLDYSDACFVETTMSAVAEWRFSCDLVGATGKESIVHFKKNAPDADGAAVMEFQGALGDDPVTIKVMREDEAQAQNQTAKCSFGDYVRIPPRFPSKCKRYRGSNTVTLRFDIDADGVPQNIEAVNYTEKCFVKAARKSVSEWRYQCDGEGMEDVETTVTFVQQ